MMFQGDLFSQQGWVDIPDGKLFWQPDFLSKEESAALFALLQNQLSWQQLPIKMFGREVLQPRLQAWFGNAYSYSGLTLSPAPLPNVLKEVKARSEKIAGIHFNSVLANYYRDGQDYMGWHQDNEAELGNEPVIASVSLGEARRFVLRHIRTQQKLEYVLNAGSC